MRTRSSFFRTLVLVACILLIWFLVSKQDKDTPREPVGSAADQSPARRQSTIAETQELANTSRGADPPTALVAPITNLEKPNPFFERILLEWQRPIEFYGKVVDENTNPVVGANISFAWSETPEREGEMTETTQSNGEGLFSLRGKHGPSLEVRVSKEGYYASHHGHWGFSYSSGDFSPDPRNPVIFRMRKQGEGTELITSASGIRPNLPVRAPRDGSPVKVDLIGKRLAAVGDLEIRQVKPEARQWQQATEWSFHMEIPDGGFVEQDEDFPFSAPVDGYKPAVDFKFSKTDSNWNPQFTKGFYIAFGQPRKYGWLRVESNIGQETSFLTYNINPSGSRNLEPSSAAPSRPTVPPE